MQQAAVRAGDGLVRAAQARALVLVAEPARRLLVPRAVVGAAAVAPAEGAVVQRRAVAALDGARVLRARPHRGLPMAAALQAHVRLARVVFTPVALASVFGLALLVAAGQAADIVCMAGLVAVPVLGVALVHVGIGRGVLQGRCRVACRPLVGFAQRRVRTALSQAARNGAQRHVRRAETGTARRPARTAWVSALVPFAVPRQRLVG